MRPMRPGRALVFVLSAVISGGMAASSARADEADGPAGFEITTYSVDCGGGTSTGAAFELHGTIGQADAHAPSVGGAFEAIGGFHAGGGGNACPADLDGGGEVGFSDLLTLLAAWGACG